VFSRFVIYRLLRKSSGVTPMSLQICRRSNGDKSLEPCMGTVVARPSWWRNCWWEPFCRANVNPSFSRMATTSFGLSTGRLLPTTRQLPVGSRRILIQVSGVRHLQGQAQLLPSGFLGAPQGFRLACAHRGDRVHKLHNSRWQYLARLQLCKHGLSWPYYTPARALNLGLEKKRFQMVLLLGELFGLRKVNNCLVRSLDYYWNQFCTSMRLMYEKLDDLGVVMAKGKIS
jgi:hypothetical protein